MHGVGVGKRPINMLNTYTVDLILLHYVVLTQMMKCGHLLIREALSDIVEFVDITSATGGAPLFFFDDNVHFSKSDLSRSAGIYAGQALLNSLCARAS